MSGLWEVARLTCAELEDVTETEDGETEGGEVRPGRE